MYKTLIVFSLCAGCAAAQTVGTAEKGSTVQMERGAAFGPIGITTALAGPMINITGAPYSAQAVTERVQVLADGNRIVQKTSGNVARDNQGRVRREESLAGLKANDGEAPHIVMIDDPVAQVHWTLDAQTKTAIKMPLPPPGKPGVAGMARAGMATTTIAAAGTAITRDFVYSDAGGFVSSGMSVKGVPVPDNVHSVKTDLGLQTIEGVPAQGTRVTRTIPAGQFGNEQPMVITSETWYSPDLKVLVMSKSSDPRMGDTTYTLTNIQRSEPDPSQFEPPYDFTVKDAPGPMMLQMRKEE